MAGKNEDISYIQSNLQEFEDEYRSLVQTFTNVFPKWNLQDESSCGSKTTNEITAILKDFKTAVSEFDFASAATLLRKAHTAADAEKHTDLLDQLDRLMDEMDIDQILSILP